MVEEFEITKEEKEMIEEKRKGTTKTKVKEEPEKFEVEAEDFEDLIETDEEEYFECDDCHYDKITKDMKVCPQCKKELVWE